MEISRIEALIVRLPIRHSGTLGVGSLDEIDLVLVKVTTVSGVVGVGECSPWAVFAENAFGIKAVIDHYLAPALLGKSVANVEEILLTMDRVHYGVPFAKAGVEMAVLDALGKEFQQPVFNLIGGLVRDRITLSYSIANQDIAKDLEESRWLIDQGFTALKIKTGVLSESAEIKRIEALRRHLGDAFDMRIDFNQGGRRDQVLRLCRRLEDFNPTFIEQPVKSWDLSAMAELTRALDVPLMADESVLSWEQGLQVIKAGAADIISIKLAKTGGIYRGKKVAAACEATGMPCYGGAMWESGIGIAAHLHFACSTPAITYGSDYYCPNFLMENDLIMSPLEFEGGNLKVPIGAGFGIVVDWEAIDRYRLR